MISLQKYFKKTLSQLFIWLAFMLMVMAPVAWLSFTHPAYSQSLHRIISQNEIFFISFRFLMILIICCTWSWFIRYRAKNCHWKAEKTKFWLHQRFKITLWLIIFEVLICENLLATFIHFLEGHSCPWINL